MLQDRRAASRELDQGGAGRVTEDQTMHTRSSISMQTALEPSQDFTLDHSYPLCRCFRLLIYLTNLLHEYVYCVKKITLLNTNSYIPAASAVSADLYAVLIYDKEALASDI